MLRATLLRHHLPTFLSTLFAQGSCICFLNLGEGDRNLTPQTHCPWGTLFLDCNTFSSLLLTLTSHGLDGRTDAPLPPLLPLTSGVTLWMVEDSSFPPSENGNGRLGSTGPGLTSASPYSFPVSLASTSQLLEHADRSYAFSQAAPAFQKTRSLRICLIPSHPTAFICCFPNVDCSSNWLYLQFFLSFLLLKFLPLVPLLFMLPLTTLVIFQLTSQPSLLL